jgi:hypothetical protein
MATARRGPLAALDACFAPRWRSLPQNAVTPEPSPVALPIARNVTSSLALREARLSATRRLLSRRLLRRSASARVGLQHREHLGRRHDRDPGAITADVPWDSAAV